MPFAAAWPFRPARQARKSDCAAAGAASVESARRKAIRRVMPSNIGTTWLTGANVLALGPHDLGAEVDAAVADEDARPGDKLADGMLVLAAEAAPQGAGGDAA